MMMWISGFAHTPFGFRSYTVDMLHVLDVMKNQGPARLLRPKQFHSRIRKSFGIGGNGEQTLIPLLLFEDELGIPAKPFFI
ncbi:MAG: hypothetical protein OEV92_01115 [Nitrospinota bacterium]|nr:hypothetical protein [Nitrospinota bacterium]